MHSKVIYLLFVLLCAASVSSHHQEGHDMFDENKGHETEVKVSPDSRGGHQISNNHFSTSEMDDNGHETPTTESAGHDESLMTTMTSKSENDSDDKTSIPPEVPTTYKSDAKKDHKKKVKPSLKKKDRSFESEDISNGSTEVTENSVDTTVSENPTTHVSDNSMAGSEISDVATTTVSSISSDITTTTFSDIAATTVSEIPTTTVSDISSTTDSDITSTDSSGVTTSSEMESSTMNTEIPKMLHMDIDKETTTLAPTTTEDVETMSPESVTVATAKDENLLIEDGEQQKSPVIENTPETTTTPPPDSEETMGPEMHVTHLSTTNIPETEPTTTSDALIVTENNEGMPSTISHLHDSTDVETSKYETESTITPTTLMEELKSDNDRLSNDLEDVQPTTMAPEPNVEVTNIRKQKQMDLERGCPCNERGVPLDPSECVGGRTAADPNCPCREVCARQTGQSCSLEEPCDEEFGLHCNLQNNTCTGM